MKYTIDLSVRGRGVQLLKLTEDEKDELLEADSLDEVYYDWVENKDWEFELEQTFLTSNCDRFVFKVTDEDGKVVYETRDIMDYINLDKTYDEDGEPQVDGWEFVGVEDGLYLTRIQTLKGCAYTAELELDEPFDIKKLYVVQSEDINDELLSVEVFPLYNLYYQRGDVLDPVEDEIECEPDGSDDEQYFDTYLMELTQGDYWDKLTD